MGHVDEYSGQKSALLEFIIYGVVSSENRAEFQVPGGYLISWPTICRGLQGRIGGGRLQTCRGVLLGHLRTIITSELSERKHGFWNDSSMDKTIPRDLTSRV